MGKEGLEEQQRLPDKGRENGQGGDGSYSDKEAQIDARVIYMKRFQ